MPGALNRRIDVIEDNLGFLFLLDYRMRRAKRKLDTGVQVEGEDDEVNLAELHVDEVHIVVVEAPCPLNGNVILKKDEEKHLLVDLKYILEKKALTFFTYFTIGSVFQSGNVYD